MANLFWRIQCQTTVKNTSNEEETITDIITNQQNIPVKLINSFDDNLI